MIQTWDSQLKGHMSNDMWPIFKEYCIEHGIPMQEDDDTLEFGSVFLTVKCWFELGWEAREGIIK